MNGICEKKMLKSYNSTFYRVIRAIPNPRFDGCILGNVYSQNWLQLELEKKFAIHLTIIKVVLC